jgi:hypothetical protein
VWHRPLVEQQVLQSLDLVVERLDRVELAVHDLVQQAVQQRRHAVLLDVAIGVPALDDAVGPEPVFFPDRDQRTRQDERGNLALPQVRGALLEVDGVRGEERAVAVAVQLRAFVPAGRVLDRVRVQAQLVGDHQERLVVRVAEVRPHHAVLVFQVVGHLLDGETLVG